MRLSFGRIDHVQRQAQFAKHNVIVRTRPVGCLAKPVDCHSRASDKGRRIRHGIVFQILSA